VDEALRYEIIDADGRELVDYTMTSRWAPYCTLELEGARRRLLVESLRVARLDSSDAASQLSDHNIEDNFTSVQLEDLRAAFDTFDADNSGDIDQDELGNVMKQLGLHPTQAEIQDMIRGAERGATDGTFDGKIDWKEFLHMMAKSMNTKDAEDEYTRCFEFFDRDGKGYIDVATFVSALRGLGQEFSDEELDLLICGSKFEDEKYDRITYKEFVKMLMAQ